MHFGAGANQDMRPARRKLKHNYKPSNRKDLGTYAKGILSDRERTAFILKVPCGSTRREPTLPGLTR